MQMGGERPYKRKGEKGGVEDATRSREDVVGLKSEDERKGEGEERRREGGIVGGQ